ncbi:MAG: DUF983 domain-containing protein [Euzebyales bacterium]|nr:DUF983 domain-containing protein [Euzebyales bacterium]
MGGGRLAMLGRALRRRCPLCGSGGIFDGWFSLRQRCPGCNFSFEREEGYWVGAMIANIAAAEGLFALVFLGGVVVTYPDVPWAALGIAGAVVMVGLPIAFYPLSKTLWLWADLALLHPLDADDLAANDRRRGP